MTNKKLKLIKSLNQLFFSLARVISYSMSFISNKIIIYIYNFVSLLYNVFFYFIVLFFSD